MAINKVIMVGRLTADPELKMTQNSTQVCSFSLAVNKGKDQPSDFFDFVAWKHTAEFLSRYFKKGDGIGVVGRLTVDSYTDKDGNKRKSYKVTADEVFFVEGKRSADDGGNTAPSEKSSQNALYAPTEALKFETMEGSDDLPF